ncbi:MAG TPA: archease [Mycobacteriales bacterium]
MSQQRGHRLVPHTADMRITAWAATREECVVEAVRAVLDGFLTPTGSGPVRTVTFQATGPTDADLLASVLDEMIYLLDVTGEVPVAVGVDPAADGLRVRFGLAPLSPDRVVGAAPKAVTLHELEFGRTDGHWRCTVTLDV